MILGQHFNKTTALNGRYGTNMITVGDTWLNKDTGGKVRVLWVSDELVTYQAYGSKTPVPMRKFVFMQYFEKDEITI